MLACYVHWLQLPLELRVRVWDHYVPGQEITKTPTKAYLEVMHECIEYWKKCAISA